MQSFSEPLPFASVNQQGLPMTGGICVRLGRERMEEKSSILDHLWLITAQGLCHMAKTRAVTAVLSTQVCHRSLSFTVPCISSGQDQHLYLTS
jgi:hypothetical protein